MSEVWLAILGYLAIGAVVGFFAGMLGIGGGAIMALSWRAASWWRANMPNPNADYRFG
jgi:uncharacterized membrane protein YfcA